MKFQNYTDRWHVFSEPDPEHWGFHEAKKYPTMESVDSLKETVSKGSLFFELMAATDDDEMMVFSLRGIHHPLIQVLPFYIPIRFLSPLFNALQRGLQDDMEDQVRLMVAHVARIITEQVRWSESR